MTAPNVPFTPNLKQEHYSDSWFIWSIVCLPTPKGKKKMEAGKQKE